MINTEDNSLTNYQEQAEAFSENFITKLKEDEIEEGDISKTVLMTQSVIDGNYSVDEIRDELKQYDTEGTVKENLYVIYANSIIEQLGEKASKLRMRSQRSISASKLATKKAAKADEKGKTKSRTKKTEEDDQFKVKKMSLEEMGEEMAQREEEEEELKKKRKEEDIEVEEERKKHSDAYQGAFNLYSDYIELKGKELNGIDSLVNDIKRLGKNDLSIRQMAIDKIISDSNIHLAYYPLVASLKDKVIIHKVIEALGKVGDFRVIDVLINIFMENYGEKGSAVRGITSRAVGDIVKIFNSREKHLGTKKIFRIIKAESFEKKLSSIIPNFNKDIRNANMKKHYYSNDCLQWLLLLSNKLIELKKKKVKAAFVKLSLTTPLSKMLDETSKEIEAALKG